MKTDTAHGDTTSLPLFSWSRWPGDLAGPAGDGKVYLATMEHGGTAWVYETPRGWQRPIAPGNEPMPPRLRNADIISVRCNCGRAHRCNACGHDTWVECHGNAHGCCRRCWYEG